MSTADELSQMIGRFVAGQSFMEFWRAFMNFYGDRPEPPDLTPDEQAEYDRVYELVYMGQPDPVSPEDRAVGLIGEAELREQLTQSPFARQRHAG